MNKQGKLNDDKQLAALSRLFTMNTNSIRRALLAFVIISPNTLFNEDEDEMPKKNEQFSLVHNEPNLMRLVSLSISEHLGSQRGPAGACQPLCPDGEITGKLLSTTNTNININININIVYKKANVIHKKIYHEDSQDHKKGLCSICNKDLQFTM